MLSRVKSQCFGGLGMLGIYGEEKIVEIKCGGPTFCFFGGLDSHLFVDMLKN